MTSSDFACSTHFGVIELIYPIKGRDHPARFAYAIFFWQKKKRAKGCKTLVPFLSGVGLVWLGWNKCQ